MELRTSIAPRKDGTVRLMGLNGIGYVFERDGEGELTASVDHEPTASHALAGGLFYPADQSDYETALTLTLTTPSPDKGDRLGPDDEGDGLPHEALPPPKAARGKHGAKR